MRSLSEALEAARARVGKGGLVVVCGSVYLVGEARALLRGDPTDPPVAM
jgi:folylpolyglutamate synthase/dihydropteroate synthase